MVTMQTGFLRRFVDGHAYGFMALTDGSNDDVFVHLMELRKAGVEHPSEGDEFEFEVRSREDGRKFAVHVKPVEPTA